MPGGVLRPRTLVVRSRALFWTEGQKRGGRPECLSGAESNGNRGGRLWPLWGWGGGGSLLKRIQEIYISPGRSPAAFFGDWSFQKCGARSCLCAGPDFYQDLSYCYGSVVRLLTNSLPPPPPDEARRT